MQPDETSETERPVSSPEPDDPTVPGSGGHARTRDAHATKHHARHEFDGWAHTYDRSIVQHLLFQPAYRLLMEELHRWRRDDPDPFDLLDIGAGTGTWTAMVAGSGLPARVIIGLDFALNMCRVAHGKGQSIAEDAPAFVNADSEHIPFADASFDVVTCSHSFHHYPNQSATVREMHRVLRPGGRLMLIDGFRDNTIGWVLYDVFIAHGESTPAAKVHHVSWGEMHRIFEAAGFRDVRQRKENIWAPLLFVMGVA